MRIAVDTNIKTFSSKPFRKLYVSLFVLTSMGKGERTHCVICLFAADTIF